MLHRLRLALDSDSMGSSGHVEADETYIGGKARNMHIKKRKRMGITQGRSMAARSRSWACWSATAMAAPAVSAPACSNSPSAHLARS
jgi:hypothetical protein